MKLKELPNIDPKSFEWAAFRWLVRRFARPSRRLQVGLTEQRNLVAITVNGELIESASDIVALCWRVQDGNLR